MVDLDTATSPAAARRTAPLTPHRPTRRPGRIVSDVIESRPWSHRLLGRLRDVSLYPGLTRRHTTSYAGEHPNRTSSADASSRLADPRPQSQSVPTDGHRKEPTSPQLSRPQSSRSRHGASTLSSTSLRVGRHADRSQVRECQQTWHAAVPPRVRADIQSRGSARRAGHRAPHLANTE